LVVDWAVNSRLIAWDREAKARARVAELSATLDNLQVYCNTLHEELHVLRAGEGPDGELDLFRTPPSMNLADDRSPAAGNEETKDDED
jgi:hypothetical protein